MYNRYIPHDEGNYQRIPFQPPSSTTCESTPQHEEKGVQGFLQKLLDRLKLNRGDLLLLLILLLLYADGEDEELLIALAVLFLL